MQFNGWGAGMGGKFLEYSPDGNVNFHVDAPSEDTDNAASGEQDRPGQRESVMGTTEESRASESG